MRAFMICITVQFLLIYKVEGHSSPPLKIQVASYNIRYASPDDVTTGNGWHKRKKPLVDLIHRHHFDIVGTQEGDKSQISEMSQLMPDFSSISHSYGGKDHLLHTGTIFYKKDKFTLIDSGVFWLSETPDKESIGWDASDSRICQWVKFQERSTFRTFYFFNTHFYWRKHLAKEQSGPLLCERIEMIAGDEPIILTGDFNSLDSSPQIRAISKKLKDAYRHCRSNPQGPVATGFPGGVFQGVPNNRIDYLFVSKGLDILRYQVYDDQYENRFPSDHLPVSVQIQF